MAVAKCPTDDTPLSYNPDLRTFQCPRCHSTTPPYPDIRHSRCEHCGKESDYMVQLEAFMCPNGHTEPARKVDPNCPECGQACFYHPGPKAFQCHQCGIYFRNQKTLKVPPPKEPHSEESFALEKDQYGVLKDFRPVTPEPYFPVVREVSEDEMARRAESIGLAQFDPPYQINRDNCLSQEEMDHLKEMVRSGGFPKAQKLFTNKVLPMPQKQNPDGQQLEMRIHPTVRSEQAKEVSDEFVAEYQRVSGADFLRDLQARIENLPIPELRILEGVVQILEDPNRAEELKWK